MRLTIPTPCREDWTAMSPRERGRYCDRCAKTVIDFSILTDEEVLETLARGRGEVCATARASQLGRPLRATSLAPDAGRPLRRYGFANAYARRLLRGVAALFAGFGAVSGFAQYDSIPSPPPPPPAPPAHAPSDDLRMMGFVVPVRRPRAPEPGEEGECGDGAASADGSEEYIPAGDIPWTGEIEALPDGPEGLGGDPLRDPE